MLDEDVACPDCVGEAVRRRFIFYPNHTQARVAQLFNNVKEICTICRKAPAKYSVSIIMQSLDREKVLRENQMIAEAARNAKINHTTPKV